MLENISMDEYLGQKNDAVTGKSLEVVEMDFKGEKSVRWNVLFEGFDEIKAITYSSGINFMYKLFELFENVEVIFGCEDVISSSVDDIFAFQAILIEKFKIKDYSNKLIPRLEDGTVHLYVAHEKLSHEKLYLLSAKDGRRRVILGSANMSYNAFGGIQRENIVYCDNSGAYDYYFKKYEELKIASTDRVDTKSLEAKEIKENIDKLPISETIKAKNVVMIKEDSEVKTNTQFVFDVKNLGKEYKPLMPKVEKKTNAIALATTLVSALKKKIIAANVQKKEERKEYPQLVIDYDNNKAELNGIELDLNPTKEDIRKDIEIFINYMNGYSKFHGKSEALKRRYYEFANWFFCSPFMAKMRDVAMVNGKKNLSYPVFGLLYGNSKGGKSKFLETLLIMMIGQKPTLQASDFTRGSIDAIREASKGSPIIVDDVTAKRFNDHAVETIKHEKYGFENHNVNYPAVIISANEDVKAVAPEIVRRTIICRAEAGLTNSELFKNSIVEKTHRDIGTALYREYLRRMVMMIPSIIDDLKDEDQTTTPDILAVSSKVLKDIFDEFYEGELPDYISEKTIENYFGEKVVGQHVIDQVLFAWRNNRKAFKVVKKRNELNFRVGDVYEARNIKKELPENLETKISGDLLSMNLEEAKAFFGINFRRI